MLVAAAAAPLTFGTPCPAPNVTKIDFVEAHSLTLVNSHFDADPVKRFPYHRLPAAAEGVVRSSIWDLSLQTAGFAVAFETDAAVRSIYVEYNLTHESLGMVHMPATGVSGADLWAQDPASGTWRWVGTTAPSATHVCQQLAALQPPGTAGAVHPTRWLLYFPLYNGVSTLRIGVPAGAGGPPTPCAGDCGGLGLTSKPIVWYGSSIAQGACASKPGDAYTNAISRALRRPVSNFGFSGNCFFETDVMRYLLEVDAAAYVVDCDPNSDARGPDFVYNSSLALGRLMLSTKPSAAIVVVSGTKEGAVWLQGDDTEHARGNAAIRKAYAALAAEFPRARLTLVDGDGIYAQQPEDEHVFWEMTVMGTHPSSLGMERFTRFWVPKLQKLLAPAVEESV